MNLNKNDYFGEISILSKYLTSTATVRAIDDTVCGVITSQQKDIINVLKEKIHSYQDKNFKLWHSLIKSIPWFEELSERSCRELCLWFKNIKIPKNQILLNTAELSKYWYFILEGSVSVNVVGESNKNREYKVLTRHLFRKIPSNSWINFLGWLLKHTTLFEIKWDTNCSLMRLSREDIIGIARTNNELQTIFTRLKAKYGFMGIKYDFYTPQSLESYSFSHKNLIPYYEEDEEIKVTTARNFLSNRGAFISKSRSGVRTNTKSLRPTLFKISQNKNSLINFLKNQLESNKEKLELVLYEAWSLFRIVDIHYYQRQALNINALQNKEIRALYECK